MSDRELEIRTLRRDRPRNDFLTWSLLALAALCAYSWLSGEFAVDDVFSARRAANAARFATEIVPHPLQGKPFDAAILRAWIGERLGAEQRHAIMETLAMSVAAIVLAGLWGAILALPAARNLMTAEPFLPSARPASAAARAAATAGVGITRAVLIFVRSVPEYVWAFLLIQIFGFTAWSAVLALAIHNTGILGKLTAETIENVDEATPRALRGLGATRAQTVAGAIFPDVLPRFLLYFFYRWETCVREATVLGMLGVLSLGSLIRDARASNFYDEMVFYVLVGAVLVLVGDVVSAVARGIVRRAS